MPFTPRNPLPSTRGTGAAAVPSNIPALCAIATELANLLDRETALIRAMKLAEIGPLQADKARLTNLCGTTLKTIDPATPVSNALRDQWRVVSKKLGDAAVANEMALRVGHAATDRLVSAIVGHIQKERTAATGYARPKPIAPGAARRPPTLAGVTIDRSL
ncbi:MAG TPA: hypothetical protein VG328_19295 [Stellaceae bacterium]|jgi:hypothetical protein|nr:hypothetical protein [Stellaceae bacterium]